MSNAVDDLFELRTNFLIGHYQAAINEGLNVNLSDDSLKLERDIYIYRSYIAKGEFSTVLEEVSDSSPPALQAVKCLASYLSSPQNKSIALQTISSYLSDVSSNAGVSANTIRLIAALIFSLESDYDKAITSIHSPVDSLPLESHALLIQLYIQIDRVDLAQKELSKMQSVDEEATITQLTSAWVNLAIGTEDKIEEAVVIYTELIQKWNTTVSLLNGLTVCHLLKASQGNKEELKLAEKEGMTALEKDGNNVETLINLIVVYQLAGKSSEAVQRFVKKVKSSAAEHVWSKMVTDAEESFDRNAARFAPSSK
eukprot:TRINITY_DN5101_c0_g1_i1.p1 TRINITY_DN5101_c0_g1~~TRINITY_DN5101_c0_g1_i1.p1  ORF type:complete len:312 (+),score=64.45 TRINITY_DN5101_c0_g1_i1:92-1027(+)